MLNYISYQPLSLAGVLIVIPNSEFYTSFIIELLTCYSIQNHLRL